MDRGSELGRRPRGRLPAAFVLSAALTLILAVSGCGKDDKVVAGGGPPPYAAPNSPQNVLANLVAAYEARDSIQTAAVYDDAYQGTSTDFTTPTPTVVSLSKADEVRHVGRLKLDPYIVSVNLDLSATSTWQRLPPDVSDPADWAVIQIQNWNVQVTNIGIGETSTARNNPLTYTFIPTVAAPGDTTWKIIRWTEIRN